MNYHHHHHLLLQGLGLLARYNLRVSQTGLSISSRIGLSPIFLLSDNQTASEESVDILNVLIRVLLIFIYLFGIAQIYLFLV
jgi:hypothetical protein